MSKSQLRKYLATLTQAQVSEILLDVYSARKEAKEYLDFFLDPDSRKKAEEFRRRLHKEFVTRDHYLRRHPRRSVCKRLIKEFASFSPEPECLADVMLYYVELASRSYRLMPSSVPDAFLASLTETMAEALTLIYKSGLEQTFDGRIEAIIDASHYWGREFHDHLCDHRERLRRSAVARSAGSPG